MISIKKNQAGQSLMEMLIAIFILIVALTATIVLVVTSIEAGRDSINKLIATNLAREGVEVIRNIRDSNWIEPTSIVAWDNGLVGPIAAPIIVPFDLDTENISLESITGFGDTKSYIYFSQTNNFYYQNNAVPIAEEQVNFYRIIYLKDICHDVDDNEMIADIDNTDACGAGYYSGYDSKVGVKVVAEVRWPNPNSGRKVQIEERIYNWQSL